MKIFICGFSGSGKSTFGEKLSSHATFQVFDLDEEIFNRMGSGFDDLGKYIEEIGMEDFRVDEFDMLKLLHANLKNNYVVSLGGGALENEEIMNYISRIGGKVVFLDVPFEVCWSRIKECQERPLVKMGESDMKTLYHDRLPNYRKSHKSLRSDDIESIHSIEDLISFLD